jgi:carbon-monoxide dehydrogenase iron sulfur subunit
LIVCFLGHAECVAYVYVEGKPTVTANIAVQEKRLPATSASAQAGQAAQTQTSPVARRWIAFDASWCRTCRVCETMCAITHEGAARPALARIRVTLNEFPADVPSGDVLPAVEEPAAAKRFVSAVVCLQCADAPCIAACPTGSLSRDPQTGAVVVDTDPVAGGSGAETACIGCMRCRKACPWDVPVRHPERKVAIKCDLCAGREGGPLCVGMCPLSGKALRIACAAGAEQGLSSDRSENNRTEEATRANTEAAR